MRRTSIPMLAAAILCFASSDVLADLVFTNGEVHKTDFADTTDVDDNSRTRSTTLNFLLGSLAVVFSGTAFSGWSRNRRHNLPE